MEWATYQRGVEIEMEKWRGKRGCRVGEKLRFREGKEEEEEEKEDDEGEVRERWEVGGGSGVFALKRRRRPPPNNVLFSL